MRVLFVALNLGGGLGAVVSTLARGLALGGHDVCVAYGSSEGKFERQLADVVQLSPLGVERPLSLLIPVSRIMRVFRPDIVVSSTVLVNCVSLIANRFSGCRCPVVFREDYHVSSQFSRRGRVKSFLVRLLIQFLYPFACRVVCVSRGVARDLVANHRVPQHRVVVIFNPVVEAGAVGHSTPAPPSLYYPWLNSELPPQVIVGVGRLVTQKDFSTLLRAFEIVASRMAGVQLVVVGDGPQRGHLERLVMSLGLKSRVSFVGWVDDARAYIAHSSVLALSSRWEGFGNVLVEAMAAGVPVVSTDCPSGPSEVLADGQYGRLVPVGDAKALAQAIEASLMEAHDSDLLRLRASEFSDVVAVREYDSVLRQCADPT